MCRHAIVTFLESPESIKCVDWEFRALVELFHQIPFCASFGVSCAGHLNDDGETFWPMLSGQLNVIVLSTEPHIKEFLGLLEKVINNHAGASLKKIKHVFGPPEKSRVEVWEIRISDNDCFGERREEFHLCGNIPKEGNAQIFQDCQKRCTEIHLFWNALAERVAIFCREHGFGTFDIDKRVEELCVPWKEDL